MESQQNNQQEMNLLELLHILVKRKILIVAVTSVAAFVSLAYSLSLPNIYSATAKILPPQKEGGGGLSALLGQAGAGLAGLATGNLSGGADLYVGILKSRSVGDAVIKRLNLAQIYKKKSVAETRGALAAAVKFEAGKDGIISITSEDKDPKLTAQLANAFVEEMERTTIRLNLSKAGSERVFLEKRLELVTKDLKAAEETLKQYSQSNKIVQVEEQAKASIEGIARLRADLAAREVQLSVLRSKQTEESPEVKAMVSGINRVKSEIARLSGSNGGSQGIPSFGDVPGVGLEYARRMRELKTQEAIFEQLTKQYEMAKLSEAKDSSSFQVLDEAVVPIYKSRPARAMIIITMTAAAFAVAVVIAFVLEFLERMSEENRTIFNSIKRSLLTVK